MQVARLHGFVNPSVCLNVVDALVSCCCASIHKMISMVKEETVQWLVYEVGHIAHVICCKQLCEADTHRPGVGLNMFHVCHMLQAQLNPSISVICACDH